MGRKFGNGTGMGIKSYRHDGNGIGNGNELMGMVGNGNVATHSRTSLVTCSVLLDNIFNICVDLCNAQSLCSYA